MDDAYQMFFWREFIFEKRKIQKAVFQAINDVNSNIDMDSNWQEMANCKRASLYGITYWDIPLMNVYARRKRKIKTRTH